MEFMYLTLRRKFYHLSTPSISIIILLFGLGMTEKQFSFGLVIARFLSVYYPLRDKNVYGDKVCGEERM